MPNSDAHIPAPPTTVSETKRRAKQNTRRRPRRRIAIVILMVTGIAACGWYLGRPYLLVREAKTILATDPQEAASLLEQVVASNGDSFPDAQVLWSRALLRSGRWEEAIGCFSQIQPVADVDSGDLLALAEDANLANIPLLEVMALDAVQTTDTRRAEAIIRLLELRRKAGDLRRTILHAEELTQLRPQEPGGWLAKARAHEQMMALPEAISSYKAALECNLSDDARSQTLRALVQLQVQTGDIQNARSFQEQLKKISQPLSIPDQINEARLLRLEGDIANSRVQIDNVLLRAPDNPEALELSGTLAMEQSDYEKAEISFSKVLSVQPWNKKAHYKLGQVLSRSGQTEKAATHFNENRRLLRLSTRIVELQQNEERTTQESDELINAMEQLGMHAAAEAIRRRLL